MSALLPHMIEQSSQVISTPRNRNILDGLLRPLFTFVFPQICFVCKAALSEDERKVCRSCWGMIREIAETGDLYRETAGNLISSGTVNCLLSAYYFDKDGPLQSLIHELKYNSMTSLGVALGNRLGMHVKARMLSMNICGLVPVPLHKVKLRERGYNQSEFICKGISDVTGIPVIPGLLQRNRYTQSQTKLNIEERKQNVSDAFGLNESARKDIAGKTFVIVDDVITTGATLIECAGVLKVHGAKPVVACSIALAP